MPLVVVLSLCAAFLLAASAALQQRAAARTRFATSAGRERAVPGFGLLDELTRDPLWLVGWAANIGGFLVQALALHLGSTAEVQPLMVTQLLFALPLGLVGTGRRMPANAWWGAAGICGGLATLLASRAALPAAGEADRSRLLIAIAALLAAAAVLVVLSLGRPAVVRSALFGIAAGLFYALSAVLMKETFGRLVDDGAAATASDWVGYGLAAATLSSLLLGQAAFATGPLAPAVTGMNITNPTVSYLLAVLLYGVPAPATAGQIAGVSAGAVLTAAGVVLLARSPARPRPARPRPGRADPPASPT